MFTTRQPVDSSLPLLPAAGGHHTCRLCGGGCRSYDVMLTEIEARRLDMALWRPFLRDVPDDTPLVLLDGATGQYTLNKVDGRCVFLDADNLCIVHKEAGARAKPLACQFFPFQTVQTPTGMQLSLNVGCRRLVEMTDADTPLSDPANLIEATRLLAGVQAVTTIPDAIALTPDMVIPFAELDVWIARLLTLLEASATPIPNRLRNAAERLRTLSAEPPARDSRALFIDLHRMITAIPNGQPLRSTLRGLYMRSTLWLPALIETESLARDWPDHAAFFGMVCRQHLAGYQFSLHRTARTGFVALLAALTCAPFAADQRVRASGGRADHALNEAVSDCIDLFLSPAGQIALTEPNQQTFLREL